MPNDPLDCYRRLTPGSQRLHDQASRRLPGGVTSNIKFYPPYPIFVSRAAGSKIYDADGREYVDYCLAFGPLVAGHGHPRLVDAMRAQLDRDGSVIFGAPSELELKFADRLATLIPSAEMTRFTNSGTEATMHAIRIARGATGMTRIVKFEGHYHGVHDSVLHNLDQPLPAVAASDGIPPAILEGTIVLPFNDIAALHDALDEASDVAAVILEPIARGVIAPDRDFLVTLRELTARRGIVLIFDEVVTWPRVSLGGAQSLYGVIPDLTTLGKALGGGLPLGAVVGKRELMLIVAPPDSQPSTQHPAPGTRHAALSTQHPYVFHSGTYNGAPMALAAGLALLDLLEEDGNYQKLEAICERLGRALESLFVRQGRTVQVMRAGSMLDLYFTAEQIRSARDVWSSDLEARRALDYRLLAAGIYNSPLHRFHLSLAHTNVDLDRTVDAFEQALRDV